MSVYAVVYDRQTGEILNRVSYGNEETLKACCPHGVQISHDEYMDQPELTKKVDLATKALIPK